MTCCAVCGSEHELDAMEPAFSRPDAFMRLSETERNSNARASNDLCEIALPQFMKRQFVRATLPVHVEARDHEFRWGLWVELAETDFNRILDLWDDDQQAGEPPMQAQIANRIPGYPDTNGVRVTLRLKGPTTRPEISIPDSADHRFLHECRKGVGAHQAALWLSRMGSRH